MSLGGFQVLHQTPFPSKDTGCPSIKWTVKPLPPGEAWSRLDSPWRIARESKPRAADPALFMLG